MDGRGDLSDRAPGAPEPASDPAEPEPQANDGGGSGRGRGRRRRRRSRISRALRWTLGIGALVLAGAVAAISQTREGQALVLDAALDRARAELSGELTVGGVRSGTLLTGATLVNVRLDAADGRRFLIADSVSIRYSLPAIVTGGPPIRSTTFWGADVEISRRSADDVLNVTRLLAERPDSMSNGLSDLVDLGRIGMRGSTARVLVPAEVGYSGPTTLSEDGTPLRRILFDDLDLDLEDATLRPGGAISFEARLASLSSSVYVLERPLVLREVFGQVTFGAQGIRVRDAAFRLPSTLLRGEFTLGPRRPDGPWIPRTVVTVEGWGELADVGWVDERVPSGRFRGGATVEVPGAVEVTLDDMELELEASTVVADGWMRFTDPIQLRSMRVTANPLVVSRLEPWLGFEIPLDGWLSGQSTFSGTLVDLAATGRVTIVPTGYGGTPTVADFNGTIHTGSNPGATDLEVLLSPFNYRVLEAVWPRVPVAGFGRAHVELDGRADAGMALVADLEHETDSAATTRLRARGLVRRLGDGGWMADLRGDVAPLSMAALGSLSPELGLRGTVTGPVAARGRLDSLDVSADLETGGGAVTLEATVDLTAPASWYHVEAVADRFSPASISARAPVESSWNGRVVIDGSGLSLDSLAGRMAVNLAPGQVGDVRVDTVSAALRFSRGVLIADTLQAVLAGIGVDGRGRFGLAEGAWGASRLTFDAESLAGLRPLVMGVSDTVMVRDGLGELDRQFLRASGIDPDTLPSELDVRLAGAVHAAMSLSGGIREFDVGLLVELEDGGYRHNQVDSATIALTATGLPAKDGSWGVGASANGIVWEGRAFERGAFEAAMTSGQGSGRIELLRDDSEQYRVAGTFQYDDPGGEVGLEAAQVKIGDDYWNLVEPARIAWDDRSLTIDSLAVERAGDDPMRLMARGRLTRGGDSDFHVDLDGFHVDRIAHVAQLAELQIGGHVDLSLDVAGPSESPEIEGRFRVDGPRYGAMELTRVEGSIAYARRRASFSLQGWDGGRDAIDAAGAFPIDLSLVGMEDRTPEGPLDLTISADSLDAAIALSYLSSLEQVVGTVTGEVTVGGTTRQPEPRGLVTVSNAEWSIEAIGVRHTGVNGTLTLNDDRTVDVALVGQAPPGRSEVGGRVTLEPFLDPPLALTFTFDEFQAVDRPDVEGAITGELVLQGTYRLPVVTGTLTLDEATINVDEFQRVAGVVDLTDPLLFERGLGVDTTALVAQPLVAALRNPFFDNLRVNVNLSVPQDTWLRSVETNIEMAGDLLVAYDRREADLVLIGELEAVRGSQLVLNRTFELDGGTVSFIGRPGLNPNLDVTASTRIRRRDGDLEVQAQVAGTLIRPVVTLTTEEVGVGEADLVSYLILGQPATELGSSQAAMLRQFDQSAVESTLAGGLRYYGGALASQFGAALAQGTGFLDYLSLELGQGPFVQPQAEFGRYIGRDVFAVLVFRRPADEAENSNILGGVRVEWEPVADSHVELFIEDRFLRSGSSGLALPGLLDENRVVGVFVFHEWGY